jgi:hypothetical protein
MKIFTKVKKKNDKFFFKYFLFFWSGGKVHKKENPPNPSLPNPSEGGAL